MEITPTLYDIPIRASAEVPEGEIRVHPATWGELIQKLSHGFYRAPLSQETGKAEQ